MRTVKIPVRFYYALRTCIETQFLRKMFFEESARLRNLLQSLWCKIEQLFLVRICADLRLAFELNLLFSVGAFTEGRERRSR